MVRVKICGVTKLEDAKLAAELGAHAIGLNFYPESPRCLSPAAAAELVRRFPPFVTPVGVFVNCAGDGSPPSRKRWDFPCPNSMAMSRPRSSSAPPATCRLSKPCALRREALL